jgi:hypothetical protein
MRLDYDLDVGTVYIQLTGQPVARTRGRPTILTCVHSPFWHLPVFAQLLLPALSRLGSHSSRGVLPGGPECGRMPGIC